MSSTSPLEAIVYTSVSVAPMTGPLLENLLVEARRLNRESGVTGVLLYSDRLFMQYFEGRPAAVAQTYERILRSRQHTRIVEMMREPIAAREFAAWVMALAQPSPSELLALSTADWVVASVCAGSRSQASVGMTMLRNFWGGRKHDA